jgi:L-lactate dehydrogenase
MNKKHNVPEICISLPSIVGARGIEAVLQLPLSAEEDVAFRRSASTLRTRFEQIAEHVT